MKINKIGWIVLLSIVIGILMFASTYFEDIFNFYSHVNDKVLFIPRLVADRIYGDLTPSKLNFIMVFTFLFYTVVTFITLIIINSVRKK